VRKVLAGLFTVLVLAAASGYLYLRAKVPPLPPAPTAEELASLRQERDALRERFRAMIQGSVSSEQGLAEAPKGAVLIGVPTSFAKKVTGQIVTGLFGHTTLVLHNLKVHKEDELKAKMIFKKRTLGSFILDVEIENVRGILRPGEPTLSFEKKRLDLALPVAVPEGDGQAQLRFQWDGKGVADAVCGDMDISTAVSGSSTNPGINPFIAAPPGTRRGPARRPSRTVRGCETGTRRPQ